MIQSEYARGEDNWTFLLVAREEYWRGRTVAVTREEDYVEGMKISFDRHLRVFKKSGIYFVSPWNLKIMGKLLSVSC